MTWTLNGPLNPESPISLLLLWKRSVYLEPPILSTMHKRQKGAQGLWSPNGGTVVARVVQCTLLVGKITDGPLPILTELHTTWQHTTELHTTMRLGGVLARLCTIWANLSPTYIAVWLVRLWRGLPIPTPPRHPIESVHHRAAGLLCAARWCAARLCVIWLGCVTHENYTQWVHKVWQKQPAELGIDLRPNT